MADKDVVDGVNQNLRRLREEVRSEGNVSVQFLLRLLDEMVSITNTQEETEADREAAVATASATQVAQEATVVVPIRPEDCKHPNISIYNVCRVCGTDVTPA